MGTRHGINLASEPTDEEFQAIRDRLATEQELNNRIRDHLAASIAWLSDVIRSNPDAIRKVLGMDPLPATDRCPVCRLEPCGCERRWRP